MATDDGDWNGPGIVWRDEDRWLRRVALIVFAGLLVAIFVVFVVL